MASGIGCVDVSLITRPHPPNPYRSFLSCSFWNIIHQAVPTCGLCCWIQIKLSGTSACTLVLHRTVPRDREEGRTEMSWHILYYYWGFPDGSGDKESTCNAGDTGHSGLIPGSGRSPGEENSNPLQYSCLENPMGRGAWWASVQRVAKSQTWLSNWTAAASLIIISHTSDTRYMVSFPIPHLQPSYNKLDSQQFSLDTKDQS